MANTPIITRVDTVTIPRAEYDELIQLKKTINLEDIKITSDIDWNDDRIYRHVFANIEKYMEDLFTVDQGFKIPGQFIGHPKFQEWVRTYDGPLFNIPTRDGRSIRQELFFADKCAFKKIIKDEEEIKSCLRCVVKYGYFSTLKNFTDYFDIPYEKYEEYIQLILREYSKNMENDIRVNNKIPWFAESNVFAERTFQNVLDLIVAEIPDKYKSAIIRQAIARFQQIENHTAEEFVGFTNLVKALTR